MELDFNRLRLGDWLAFIGSIAMMVVMTVPNWYSVPGGFGGLASVETASTNSNAIQNAIQQALQQGSSGGRVPGIVVSGLSGPSLDGWTVLTSQRWIWLVAIVLAFFGAFLKAGGRKFRGLPSTGEVIALFGLISAGFIIYRMIDNFASLDLDVGIFLGLVAMLAITAGGYLRMLEEGYTIADVPVHAVMLFEAISVPIGRAVARPAARPAGAPPQMPPRRPPMPPPGPGPAGAPGAGGAPIPPAGAAPTQATPPSPT